MFRTLICALALMLGLALMPSPGLAKALGITDADPVAVVTFPDRWASAKTARGVEVRSPDDEVYVWFELVAPGDMPTVQKEHDSYFDKQGVRITSSSETTKAEVNGRAWSFTELKATNKDGASIIRYVAINPNLASGKIILMTYWASIEGDKLHDKAMDTAIKSLAFR